MKHLYKYESNSDFKHYLIHTDNDFYDSYSYLQYYDHDWDFNAMVHDQFSKLDFAALFIKRECDCDDDIVSFISYEESYNIDMEID